MTSQPPAPSRKRAPGGGQKAADGARGVTRVNLMLDSESLQILEKIGGGNLSLGARVAARRLQDAGLTRRYSAVQADRPKTSSGTKLRVTSASAKKTAL